MTTAADHLVALAEGVTPRTPLLGIDRALPGPGPAVGPGLQGCAPIGGMSLDPVPQLHSDGSISDRVGFFLAVSGRSGPLCSAEVPNTLILREELPNKKHIMRRYKSQSVSRHMYAAAAKLWAEGMAMDKARVSFCVRSALASVGSHRSPCNLAGSRHCQRSLRACRAGHIMPLDEF
jgi:hypothetical protein